MGLREFSFRDFLKKNFDFIAGILSEITLAALIMGIFALLIFLLTYIGSPV
jgi:hypothetical protein